MGQEFADKEYYLVDSLVLEELSEGDRVLIDSCLKVFHKAKDDTSKVGAVYDICLYLEHEDWSKYNMWLYQFINKELKKQQTHISSKFFKKYLAETTYNFGFLIDNQGNNNEAMIYYLESLEILKEIQDEEGVSNLLHNLGVMYYNQGNIETALKYYSKALMYREKTEDDTKAAATLNAIAAIYHDQNDIPKAIEYFEKALSIRKGIGDKNGIANSLINLGVVHNNHTTSLDYFYKSYQLYHETGYMSGIASAMNNIGGVLCEIDSIEKGIEYLENSLNIFKEENDNLWESFTAHKIGVVEFEQGNIKKAHHYSILSLEIAQSSGYPENIKRASGLLSKIYEKQGKGMKALEMYKLHVQMKDSINNEATQKATIRQQTQYEFEKAQIVKENEAKEVARLEAEATGRRDNIQYSLIFLGILVLFGIVLSLGFIKVSPTIAEGIIFFAFLILFEFVLVFTEPYLEQYTNGEPMYNLLANSLLALVIFPLHAILEKLLKKRIVKS